MPDHLIYTSPAGFFARSEFELFALSLALSVALLGLGIYQIGSKPPLAPALKDFPKLPVRTWARLISCFVSLYLFVFLGLHGSYVYASGALGNAQSVQTNSCAKSVTRLKTRSGSSGAAWLRFEDGTAYYVDFWRDYYSIRREVLQLRTGDAVELCEHRGKIVHLVRIARMPPSSESFGHGQQSNYAFQPTASLRSARVNAGVGHQCHDA